MAFEEYYKDQWQERWSHLKKAMESQVEHTRLSQGLLQEYYLDPASLVPPRVLEVEPGMKVLDLCAAPGGKSLQLAMALKGTGILHCNDLSARRIQRLQQVLKEHLPIEWNKNILCTHHDGSRWGLFHNEEYHRVLLDAPCSSERHLIQAPQYLKDWSKGRIRNLSQRQLALICAAMDSLQPGGRLVYSTCALAKEENQGVIEKALKKRKGLFRVVEGPDYPGEKRDPGYHILPDRQSKGPIYYCVLEKLTTDPSP